MSEFDSNVENTSQINAQFIIIEYGAVKILTEVYVMGDDSVVQYCSFYIDLRLLHSWGKRDCDNDFKEYRRLAIPACITARAWRTCRDACRDR